MNWMLLPLKRYFDFKGRSRRMEYWMYVLLNIIVWTVLLAIKFSTDGIGQMAVADQSNPLAIYGAMFSGPVGMILLVWMLANFIPMIAVGVRRLHDRDMSGWWYLGVLIANFIPLINILVSIGFLVLMLLPGTAGPNRFGPDPKNPTSADVFS